jgi:import inner membrane translocase subunit TIM50
MGINDVREAIKSFDGTHIPTEYARREALLREQFNKQLAEQKKTKSSFNVGSLISSALGIKPQGGLVTEDGKSVSEGLAEGKMLQDQIRERGMKQYEALEKEIREKGEMWLKEEKELEAKMQADQMKSMKTNFFSIWSGQNKPPENPSGAAPSSS